MACLLVLFLVFALKSKIVLKSKIIVFVLWSKVILKILFESKIVLKSKIIGCVLWSKKIQKCYGNNFQVDTKSMFVNGFCKFLDFYNNQKEH